MMNTKPGQYGTDDISYHMVRARQQIDTDSLDLAMLSMGRVVESVFQALYAACENDFSQNVKSVISEFPDKRPFVKLPLGQQMNLLNSEGVLLEIEELTRCSCASTRKLLDDEHFVKLRNSVAHGTAHSFERRQVERYFDLVMDILRENKLDQSYNTDMTVFSDHFKWLRQRVVQRTAPSEQPVDEDMMTQLSQYHQTTKTYTPLGRAALFEMIGQPDANICLFGEGGSGKSTYIRCLYQHLLKQGHDSVDDTAYTPVPLLIFASEITAGLKLKKPLSVIIGEKFGCHLNDIKEEYQQIRAMRAFSEEQEDERGIRLATRPFFVLLLDGLNEISYSDSNEQAFVNSLLQLNTAGVQILMTSRSFTASTPSANTFLMVRADGVEDSYVQTYIHEHADDKSPDNAGLLRLLKNPMMLVLYRSTRKAAAQAIDSDTVRKYNCKANIMWNYMRIAMLQEKVFQNSDLRDRDKEVYRDVILCTLPRFALSLAKEDRLSKQVTEFDTFLQNDNYGKSYSNERIRDFLVRTLGLVAEVRDSMRKTEVGFAHQNYRDFFAALAYTVDFNVFSSDSRNEDTYCTYRATLAGRLKEDPIPADIKQLVGELLNREELFYGDPLREILEGYRGVKLNHDLADYTIYNIFEIFKSTNELELVDFADIDTERLNLNDIQTSKVIGYINKSLNGVSSDHLLSAMNPLDKNKDDSALDRVMQLFMLSVRCASNEDKDGILAFYDLWVAWTSRLLNNKTKLPAENILFRLVFAFLAWRKLSINILANVMTTYLKKQDFGTNDNSILNVFREVSNNKAYFQAMMDIVDNKRKIDNQSIAGRTYELASTNGLASNFVIFVLNYYLFSNLDDGMALLYMLREKMEMEKDMEKRILVRFRMISAMNYCVQESRILHAGNQEMICQKFKPLMRDLLETELYDFSEELADHYRCFRYGYYFPFGIHFEFDNACGEEDTLRIVVERALPEDGPTNLPLLKKLIFDVACFSADSFFSQDSTYLDRTYLFFGDLIQNRISQRIRNQKNIKMHLELTTAVTEALAILYWIYPLKTEFFLDKMTDECVDKDMQGWLQPLKNALPRKVYESAQTLCDARSGETSLNISELVTKYKNMWLFADLANYVFLSFDDVRKGLVFWGEHSFYKNIDVYKVKPVKFFRQTLTELFNYLDKNRKEAGTGSIEIYKESNEAYDE